MIVRPLVLTSFLLSAAVPLATAESSGVREVTARTHSIISLTSQLRHFTTIVLPDDEEIIDVSCADPDFWVVQSAHNIARVKPAETGAKTNLDLQTTKHLYSFRLREATGTKAAPDFKVFVRPEEPGHVRYVPIADLEALQAELKEARAALAAEQRRSADAIKAHKTQYVTTLQFAYRWEDKDDLRIRAIWHDGQSTYLQLQGRELPALYADKDGPALTNYQVLGGRTYVVPKVLERGTLAVGKTRVRFERR